MASRTPSRATSLIALLAVVLLLATACSDDSGDSADTEGPGGPGDPSAVSEVPADGETTTTVPGEEPPGESAAASLRADLTGLFEEQVYLTGFTVESAVSTGGRLGSEEATAMADATAESAAELADVLGAAYGVEAGVEFLEVWEAHQDAIIQFGLGDGTAEAVTTARDAVVSTLESFDEEADFSAVASGLQASDDEMLGTVEEMASGEPAAAVDLRAAAEEMPEVALGLSEVIVEHSLLEGEVDSPESALRAELTGLMQESALLTGLGLAETVQSDGDSSAPGPAGVLEAVDENTIALAEVMVPDEQGQRDAFGEAWGSHIGDFEDYTTALLGDDAAGIQDALDELVIFRDDIGVILADTYPAFSKEAVAEELVPHTDSIVAYADALVVESLGDAEEIESPTLLRAAALAMRQAARYFAGGLSAPAA